MYPIALDIVSERISNTYRIDVTDLCGFRVKSFDNINDDDLQLLLLKAIDNGDYKFALSIEGDDFHYIWKSSKKFKKSENDIEINHIAAIMIEIYSYNDDIDNLEFILFKDSDTALQLRLMIGF